MIAPLQRQAPLAESGRVVVAAALAAVAMAVVAVLAEERSFVALGLQVLVVEFTAGKLAVPWTSAFRPLAGVRDLVGDLGRGAALACAAVVVGGVGAAALGVRVEVERVVGWGAIMAIVELGLSAARDEVLLRGILRRGFATIVPQPWLSLALAGAGAAWAFGLGEAHAAVLLREGALALVAVELWRLADGAFMAIGFQLAFRFLEASYGGAQAKPSVLFVETVVLVVAALALTRRREPEDLVAAREASLGRLPTVLH